jgi:hypothetical protein
MTGGLRTIARSKSNSCRADRRQRRKLRTAVPTETGVQLQADSARLATSTAVAWVLSLCCMSRDGSGTALAILPYADVGAVHDHADDGAVRIGEAADLMRVGG